MYHSALQMMPCATSDEQKKCKNQKEKLENKLKKSLCYARESVDTAGSYQFLVISTRKSGTFCDRTRSCRRHILPHLFTKCQRGRTGSLGWALRYKRWGRWRWPASRSLKGVPAVTFPAVSLANDLCSCRAKLQFRGRSSGKVRMGRKCMSNLLPKLWSSLNHLSFLCPIHF